MPGKQRLRPSATTAALAVQAAFLVPAAWLIEFGIQTCTVGEGALVLMLKPLK